MYEEKERVMHGDKKEDIQKGECHVLKPCHNAVSAELARAKYEIEHGASGVPWIVTTSEEFCMSTYQQKKKKEER